MTDLFRRSAVEISRDVRAQTLSAVEVTQAHLDRLDQVNPAINAVVQQDPDAALEQARGIDAQIAAGEDPGLMAGVPCTIKVNVDQEGFATTNGLVAQKDLVAQTDSPVVANLRKAGAVLIGRTNTPAFSLRWFAKNDLHGQTLNPRNRALTPGGSSGGASAAVAAGICPVAHGTDIAGSVRYPAYACGLHGLRPSFGRIPAVNFTGPDRNIGAQIMAVSGPLARSIADLRLSLEAMAAQDPRDPWWVPAPLEGAPYSKRAALTLAPDGMPVAGEVKEALIAAARTLEAAGWHVDEVPCPPIREAAELNACLWMAESHAAPALAKSEAEADAQFVYDRMSSEIGAPTLEGVMSALQRRLGLAREWALFFETYPLVICPMSGELPFEQQSDVRSEADFFRIYEAQLTQRGLPLIGVPALSVATGQVGDAPIGVQLVAGRFREDILLAAGAAIEAERPMPDVSDPV